MDTFSAIKFFGALFAIMNPVSNLPIFLSVTEGATSAQRRSVAIKLCLYCVLLGAVFAVAGNAVLNLFGISIDDFKVAGGLVVLMIGLNMLHGNESSSHHGSATEQASFPDETAVAFYPLAFPILVGPGTITTLIVYRKEATTNAELALYAGIFVALSVLVAFVFAAGGQLEKYLSSSARVIMTRLMGMILLAISVEMITGGLRVLLPGLAS